MKVLHVEAGRHIYGGAKQVIYLIDGLNQRGIDCVLVCDAGSAIAEEFKKRKRRLYEINMAGDLDVRLIWRLKRIIDTERPDIVHLHSRRGADIMGGLAANLAGVKTVLSRRVDNTENPILVRWKYRLYHKVIAISEGIRQVLLSEGVASDKVVCVRSAVSPVDYLMDCDRQWFLRIFDIPQDAKVIAVIAQLIPRKGHRFLLEALPKLIEDFPELRILFFGQGSLEKKLREQINHMGLHDHVILAGFRTDLPRMLPCFDLVVHPALMEGLGISLLQATGAGVPIVAVNAGGMPEVVRDGINGLLVPPADVGALADAIYRLLSDRELLLEMSMAGKWLMEEFSVDKMVNGNLEVYRDLLQ